MEIEDIDDIDFEVCDDKEENNQNLQNLNNQKQQLQEQKVQDINKEEEEEDGENDVIIIDEDDAKFTVIQEKDENNVKKINKLRFQCQKWLEVSQCGNIVEGTNFIPGKTPLLLRRWKKLFDTQEQRCYFGKMLEQLKEQGKPIKLIIDLTEENNYYTFWKLQKKEKYGLKEIMRDVEYQHYPLSLKTPPRKADLNKLYAILNKHMLKKDFYIFIHCFCGINRTGYLISYFLGKKFNLKSSECIKRFEEARGCNFQKQYLIEDLQEKFD